MPMEMCIWATGAMISVILWVVRMLLLLVMGALMKVRGRMAIELEFIRLRGKRVM
jgi:hypothetical protein